ncbi:hypothetical protein CLV46_1158 [Diaminobutyricimonas aerilata]|uniref:Uncharacterized protein n=1 Tax=Diaminobutyricimonas aerilata TaxID=1162967 RepID=A0A2M9CIB9_9MICO|nr:hypothetical protein CLV46_1158 [Diaminobutyricimonas aerilata]
MSIYEELFIREIEIAPLRATAGRENDAVGSRPPAPPTASTTATPAPRRKH